MRLKVKKDGNSFEYKPSFENRLMEKYSTENLQDVEEANQPEEGERDWGRRSTCLSRCLKYSGGVALCMRTA